MTKSVVYLACACAVRAQAPTGSIADVVRDPTGAAVSAAQVKAVGMANGLERTSFPSLLASEYE